jgi:hypothetical protein
MQAGLDGCHGKVERPADLPRRPSMHHLHSNWCSEMGAETTDCALQFELALMQVVSLLRIRSGVLHCEQRDLGANIKRGAN